ncbi:MAG: hypothetical protein H7831_16070 [Magnetococcus sp. WYHC-3]
MSDILSLIVTTLTDSFKSRATLQLEILAPRHPIHALRRKQPKPLTMASVTGPNERRLTPGSG